LPRKQQGTKGAEINACLLVYPKKFLEAFFPLARYIPRAHTCTSSFR